MVFDLPGNSTAGFLLLDDPTTMINRSAKHICR
jgi:hypothetical protein